MAEAAEQETPPLLGLVDVETVFDFLRQNGLAEAELALREDVIERNRELGSFDFEKFLFDLPPVRIPASFRRTELKGGDDRVYGSKSSSGSSSVDEFVSLGSSTSGVCSSSGFSNPYGRRTASLSNSETSSDSLSQFATARDYPDFDVQNDFYLYDEKEESHFMTPCFQRQDFFGSPSEDKFVMSSETELQFENPLGHNGKSEGSATDVSSDYLDKQCVFNVLSTDKNEAQAIDHFSDKRNWPEEGIKEDTTSLSLCKCCPDVGGIHGSVSVDYSCLSFKEPFISAFQLNVGDVVSDGHIDHLQREKEDTNYSPNWGSKREFKNSGGIIAIGINDYGVEHGAQMDGETDELVPAADREAIIDDELSMYDAKENEYEVFDLRIIHRKNRTGFEENKDLPIVLNTVIAGRYYVTEYLGSAAFSKVIQAQDLYMGINVCLKIIKNDKDFFDQSLDEIKLLKLVNKHDPADERHILRLYDYFYHQEHLFIVCELLRANLYEFQKFNQESGGEPYFTLSRLQIITRQCLEALDYLHHLGIIHCDLKPENILIKSYRKCEIKVIDLGSSCFQSDNLCLYVQSRSYRAPEVMIGLSYDQKIDLWSLGCILAELWSGEVLFPNDTVVMILGRMIGLLGPIDSEMLLRGQETNKYFTEEHDLYYMNEETHQVEYVIPEESSLEHHLQISDFGFIDFVRNLLEVNPLNRPTAREALEHPWLSHVYPN